MAVTKRGIYYPNDGTQKADVMTDMQKMAESIDDALGENQFDPTQINEKIVNLQVSQSTQDLAIENLQGAFLNSDADEDKSIEINDASGLGKLSVLGNHEQDGEPSTGSPIPIICVGSNKKNLLSKDNKLEKIRVNSKNGKYFAHTLNNTVVAPPRMLIAFLENNLNADGSVNIPEALRPYMGGCEVIVPKKK